MAVALGIDLGTTNTVIASYKDNRPEVIETATGSRITPSIIWLKTDEALVGPFANKAKNAEELIYNVKRIIGKNFTEIKHDIKSYPFKLIEHENKPLIRTPQGNKTPEEINSLILKYFLKSARDRLGNQELSKAVITVPAYFNIAQRQATKKSAELAGLEVLNLLNEPTAAALEFAHGNIKEKLSQTILVYDFGGGTFDISVIKINEGEIIVRGIDGDTHLGGNDIDEILVRFIVDKMKKDHNITAIEPKRMKQIREKCRHLKEELAFTKETRFSIEYPLDNEIEYKITVEEFNALILDLIQRTEAIMNRCLKQQRIEKDEIDQILLVGGSSRILLIEEMLEKSFRKGIIRKTLHRDEAVANGAAIYAAKLHQNEKSLENFNLIDVLSYSLGTDVANDTMSFILRKNQQLPAINKKLYKTNRDNQTVIFINIFEGEDKSVTRNRLVGGMRVDGIQPAPKGNIVIEVTFLVDSDGILHVTAKETSGKLKKELNITL